MRREKGVFSFLFLSVVAFAAVLSISYFVAFKLYFTQTRVIKAAHSFIYSVINQESRIYHASFSPMGNFQIKKLEILRSGDYSNLPARATISTLDTKIKLYKLPLGKISMKDFNINGFDFYFTYGEIKKFNFVKMINNANSYISRSFQGDSFSDIVKIENIRIDNGVVSLFNDKRTMIFRRILLESSVFDSDTFFDGRLFFYLESRSAAGYINISMDFRFDKNENVIYISKVKIDGIDMPGEGKIFLKNSGGFNAQFFVDESREITRQTLINIIGNEISYNEFSAFLDDIKEDFQITYLKE
ncbi:MAG: hypothetical protein LBQ37_04765 [Elusimicrobiota bacterium]|jgi:hypothetical protein|nr:hypothetical protein [Elusimicrobiota bacterium]